ncbi:unnamed protein product [Cladocopium goreaui]|uniref:Crt-like 3 n=1 Tax=Cladocopium goreaui TaxID=2562237 RepID=A0A9P1C362_9DINO|nr:unnamed protein product [Cladocopium goreaui]
MNCEPCASSLRSASQSSILVCAVNCCVSVVSTCLYYSELHHLHQYPFFSAQLNTAIGALLAGLWLLWLPKDVEVETAATVVPWQSWAWLSALLAFQNSLEILSIPRVMAGFLPSLWVSGLQHVSLAWVAIFLLSRIPQAAANVAAESWAENQKGITWPLRATLYTQLLGLPCNFLAALTVSFFWKGEAAVVLQDYAGGFSCLTEGQGACAGAWRSVLLFAVPGMLYTLTEFQVLQVASATTYFLLAALQLPLQDLALSLLNFSAASFRPAMVPAILAVAMGLMFYGLGSRPGSS